MGNLKKSVEVSIEAKDGSNFTKEEVQEFLDAIPSHANIMVRRTMVYADQKESSTIIAKWEDRPILDFD